VSNHHISARRHDDIIVSPMKFSLYHDVQKLKANKKAAELFRRPLITGWNQTD